MNNTYSLRNLITYLFGRIWLIIILSAVFGFGAFFISKFVVNPRYESYTTMYVKNNNSTVGQTSANANVDLNDLNTAKSLASTYITVLKSNAVMEQVSIKLTERYEITDLARIFDVKNEKLSIKSLKEAFTMSAVDETEVIKITANTLNPEVSADLCNIIGEIAPDFLIRVVGAGSVEIIDTATASDEPVSPNVPRMSILGAFIGFCLSITILIVAKMFDDTIKDTESLTKKHNKPILGEVQAIESEKSKRRKKGSDSQARALLTDKSIPFSVSESYKSIRSNILFSLGTTDKRVIAVSSPNPSEGKSTTAANIAIALAQTGSSVLLIDADMRKPVQHKTFKIKNAEGLSTLIIKKSSVAKSIKSNVINNLDLLPSGPIPPNPSELLASENFNKLLEQLSGNYDYIIIDTPPVNVVSDAMVMKDNISGILLVLKYGATTYEDVSNCMKQIELAQANMFGFVLNEIHHSHSGSYYNYKYKYKYGYGSYGYGYKQDSEESEAANAD